jgi:predicted Zn-dependent protease
MRLVTALGFGFSAVALLAATSARGEDAVKDPLLAALVAELTRSKESLSSGGDERMYYLAYRVTDANSIDCSASYGAIDDAGHEDENAGRRRTFDITLRVGSPKLDNTHRVRGEWSWGGWGGGSSLPIEDDAGPIRVALWHATDESYKQAVRALIKVKANKAVRTEEEDKADDFSVEPPHVEIGDRLIDPFDLKAWKDRCKRLSALFKDHPMILSSSVSVSGSTGTTYFVDSDGARIREPKRFLRIFISGAVKADDGMDLDLYDGVEATTVEQLPTEDQLAAKTAALIATLEKLRVAPVVDPYNGPAIIMNRAAGVFFHEVFGHRAEGHRMKNEDEGQTFKKKLNEKVVPDFISVIDDPTQRKFGEWFLNGYYRYDDEGQPAQATTLVENGVLKAFLMGRTPIDNFPHSNGHGRAQAGLAPVSRQGNLIAKSAKTIPFADLRKKLIEEVVARGKPYGLMFQDIAGGFTNTQRGMPQAFDVLPLVVFKVYVDGRPDELVRGVNLVGTPLASFEKILATGDDYAVFNGYCGAESGWVPVSAVSPSLLVSEMEVEKKEKGSDRVPILPPPLHPKTTWPEVKTDDGKPEGGN